MDGKKLYRSRKSRMLCGVCGGIGEYFNIDPTLIRLAFVLFGCTGGGILAYSAVILLKKKEGVSCQRKKRKKSTSIIWNLEKN